MNHWTLELSKRFIKELSKLDRPMQSRIRQELDEIAALDDPRARGKGLTANLAGYWRYRVGDYRIVAEIRDRALVIVAIAVGHRSGDIYD